MISGCSTCDQSCQRSGLTAMGICSHYVLMPEPYWPKRKNVYLLSDAKRNGSLVLIRCYLCHRKRFYDPDDLRQVLGNVEVDAVMQVFRCPGCGKREFIDAKAESPTAADRQKIRLRRLVEIRAVRRPVWRDEA